MASADCGGGHLGYRHFHRFCHSLYRFPPRIPFKQGYLALALLPPTLPLVIIGLAMLAWLSQVGLAGTLTGIVIAHVVLATPFAMAICRLRLSQMDTSPEPAACNLGACHRLGAVPDIPDTPKSLDLDSQRGECLALMGSSGCGKVTTLRMLAGLEAPSSGMSARCCGWTGWGWPSFQNAG